MKSVIMRIQMFFIAAALNIVVVLNQSVYKAAPKFSGTASISSSALGLMNYYMVAFVVIGALGCTGILLTHVARRRKELAINITIGATTKDVFNIVANWTLKAAGIPALLGFAFSTTLLFMPASESFIGISLYFNPFFSLLFFAIMLAFCLLVTLYPAYKAATINIVQALASQ